MFVDKKLERRPSQLGLLELFRGCSTVADYCATIEIALDGSGALDEYEGQSARLSPSIVILANKLHGVIGEGSEQPSCTDLTGFVTSFLTRGNSPITQGHLRRSRPKVIGLPLELETEVLDARCRICDKTAEILHPLLERVHKMRQDNSRLSAVQLEMPVEDRSAEEAAEAEERQLRTRIRAEPYSPPDATRITAYVRATDMSGGPMVAKFLEAATSFRDWREQSGMDVVAQQEAKQYRTPVGDLKGTRIEFGAVKATGNLAPLGKLYFVPPELHDCADYVFQLQTAERWFGTRANCVVCARCGNTLLPYATPSPGAQCITALFGSSTRFTANDQETSPQGHEVVQPGCCSVDILHKGLDLRPLERPQIIVRQHIVVRVSDPTKQRAYLLAVEDKILWGGSSDFSLRTYRGPFKRAIEAALEMANAGRDGIANGPFYVSARKPRT